ncbi:Rv2993c-like domain-containing protein [Streptomyces sp. L7]
MRYTRVAVGGRAVWGRVVEEDIELLSESPLEGDPSVIGSVPVADAQWLPVVVPPVFYAVGMNYPRHIAHAGAETPDRPEVGYRANNALTGHRSPIVKPDGVEGPLRGGAGTRRRHRPHPQARLLRRGPASRSSAGPSATTSAPAPGSTRTAPSGAARTATRSSPWGRG